MQPGPPRWRPGARADRIEGEALDAQAEACLRDLRLCHERLAVEAAELADDAVARGVRAPAADLRLDEHHEVAGVGMRAGDDRAADGRHVARAEPLREVRRHRPPDQLRAEGQRLPVDGAGRGALGGEDRSRRADHPQRREGAVVRRRPPRSSAP